MTIQNRFEKSVSLKLVQNNVFSNGFFEENVAAIDLFFKKKIMKVSSLVGNAKQAMN